MSNEIALARAKASARAKVRLAKKHKNEYQELYRDECAKLNVSTRATTEQRIAKLQAIIDQLKNEG